MTTEHSPGRPVGILLILQMAAGLILAFVLTDALKGGYPSFLETAAGSSVMIRAGAGLGALGAVLTLLIGASMFRFISERSLTLAVFFMAACTMSAGLDLVHNATILSMLSASQQYLTAAGAGTDTSIYNAWGIAAASMRRSVHIAQLAGIGAWIFTFYFSLFRFRFVPRPIAILGLAGILSQFTGVTLMMFLGISPLSYLAIPLAPIHLTIAGWIIAKGLSATVELQEESS